MQLCIAVYVTLNGFKAFTLFDSGSTTDSISLQAVRVVKLPVFTLEDSVSLQLGCMGSRSKIFYSAELAVEFASIDAKHHFNVINIDRYDCILGTHFMRRYGVMLDFQTNTICVGGKPYPYPTLSVGEEAAVVSNRQQQVAQVRQPQRASSKQE
ncbi:hypothetical protein BV22DRAFT_1026271 [Leucogyrophana mollusca]|uniref:Uncharacterized protein n=1 Tax=Leucogyrophana mollusca TaxID=85980 RepID=A0ACB8AVD1_9AGAM|nr:hypothetical protein BV22DRAFT_1026271 [Leucogyrophana mollusca]